MNNTDSKQKNLTEELTNSLQQIMNDEIKQLPKLLNDLEAKQRVNVLCKLMPYVVPKQTKVEEQKTWFGL